MRELFVVLALLAAGWGGWSLTHVVSERSALVKREWSSAVGSPQVPSAKPLVAVPRAGLETIDQEGVGELEKAVRAEYPGMRTYYRLRLRSGESLAVGYTPDEEWLDVVTRTRRKGEKAGRVSGPYESFGYSLTAGRWSDGEAPAGAAEIRRLIAKSFGTNERGRWV